MTKMTKNLIDADDLMTAADIARTYGVTQAAVSRWTYQDALFPEPVAKVNNDKTWLWLGADITLWYVSRPQHGRSWANRSKDLNAVQVAN